MASKKFEELANKAYSATGGKGSGFSKDSKGNVSVSVKNKGKTERVSVSGKVSTSYGKNTSSDDDEHSSKFWELANKAYSATGVSSGASSDDDGHSTKFWELANKAYSATGGKGAGFTHDEQGNTYINLGATPSYTITREDVNGYQAERDSIAGIYEQAKALNDKIEREQKTAQAAQTRAGTTGLKTTKQRELEQQMVELLGDSYASFADLETAYNTAKDNYDAAWSIYEQANGTNAAKGTKTRKSEYYEAADNRVSSLPDSEYAEILNAKDYAKNSKSDGVKVKGQILYNYINNIGDTREKYDSAWMEELLPYSDYSKYSYMTADEVGVYNYIYNTQGSKAAENFVKYLEPELEKQAYSGISNSTTEWANKNTGTAIAASAATVLMQPERMATSVAALLEDSLATATGEGVNPYSIIRRPSNLTQDVRSSIANNIATKTVTDENGYSTTVTTPGGQIGSFLYQTTMSALDSAVNMAVAGGIGSSFGLTGEALMKTTNILGAGLMSSEVASLTVAESKLKGYSDIGALSLGLVRGGIEYATEAIGGERVMKIIKANPTKVWYILAKSMIPEGIEEVAADIGNGTVNIVVDKLFNTQESGIPALMEYYEKLGKKNPELWVVWSLLKQAGTSFAGGALAAGFSSGIQTHNYMQAARTSMRQLGISESEAVELMNRYGIEDTGLLYYAVELFDVHSAAELEQALGDAQGAEQIYEKATHYNQYTRPGQAAIDSGTAENLRQTALTYGEDTEAYRLAKEMAETSDADSVGKLFRAMQSGLTEQNRSDIRTVVEEAGFTGKNADVLTEALTRSVEGERLTGAQQRALNDPEAQELMQTVLAESPAAQRTTSFQTQMQEMGRKLTSDRNQARHERERSADNAKAIEETTSENVSETGKTINKTTGEEITIKGVKSVKNGEMVLETSDGEVNASDVSYASEDEAIVYEGVAGMDVNAVAAQALINAYTGNISGAKYLHGIREAFRYGEYNMPISDMQLSNGFSSELNSAQQNTAYRLGQMFGGKKTAKAEAIVRSLVRGRGNRSRKGSVTLNVDRSNLSTRQRASVDVLEKIAEATGVDFVMFASKPEKINGKTVRVYTNPTTGKTEIAPNGKYENGKIYIDLNAGNTGEGIILFTAAHELTHHIAQWSPAKFRTLANFLTKKYGEKGASVAEMVHAQQDKAKDQGRSLSFDEAYEEFVADSMETMFQDGDVLKSFAELRAQDSSLFSRIKNWVTDFTAKVDKAVAEYRGQTAETMEGKFVAEMDEGLDTLKGLFTEALDEASRNYQRAVGTATETIESAAQTVNEAVETVEQITEAVEEKIENADEEKPTAALEVMAEAAEQIGQAEQTINEAEQKVNEAVKAVEEAEAKLDEGADKTATQEVREQAEEAKKEIKEARKKTEKARKKSGTREVTEESAAADLKLLKTGTLKEIKREYDKRFKQYQRESAKNNLEYPYQYEAQWCSAASRLIRSMEAKGHPRRTVANVRNTMMSAFSTAYSQKTGITELIDKKLNRMIAKGTVRSTDVDEIFEALMEAGQRKIDSSTFGWGDEVFENIRRDVKGTKLYISDKMWADFSKDEAREIKARAKRAGIILTKDARNLQPDSLTRELADAYGEDYFPTDIAAQDQFRNIIDMAERGLPQKMTLAESLWEEAKAYKPSNPQEAYDEMIDDLESKLIRTMREFAEDNGLKWREVKQAKVEETVEDDPNSLADTLGEPALRTEAEAEAAVEERVQALAEERAVQEESTETIEELAESAAKVETKTEKTVEAEAEAVAEEHVQQPTDETVKAVKAEVSKAKAEIKTEVEAIKNHTQQLAEEQTKAKEAAYKVSRVLPVEEQMRQIDYAEEDAKNIAWAKEHIREAEANLKTKLQGKTKSEKKQSRKLDLSGARLQLDIAEIEYKYAKVYVDNEKNSLKDAVESEKRETKEQVYWKKRLDECLKFYEECKEAYVKQGLDYKTLRNAVGLVTEYTSVIEYNEDIGFAVERAIVEYHAAELPKVEAELAEAEAKVAEAKALVEYTAAKEARSEAWAKFNGTSGAAKIRALAEAVAVKSRITEADKKLTEAEAKVSEAGINTAKAELESAKKWAAYMEKSAELATYEPTRGNKYVEEYNKFIKDVDAERRANIEAKAKAEADSLEESSMAKYSARSDVSAALEAGVDTSVLRGNVDGGVVSSPITQEMALYPKRTMYSTRTEYSVLPKQIMSLSGGENRLLTSLEGVKSGKKLAGASTFTGRDVRHVVMLRNGFTEANVKNSESFMDSMKKLMDKAGVEYKFIGLKDVSDATLHYRYDAQGNIQSVVLSAMVNNGEYPVNFDLSTICKKREAMSAFLRKISQNGTLDSGTVQLTRGNIFKLNTALKNAGYETACLGCFVESRRYSNLEWAKTFCDKWNAEVKAVNPNATKFGYGDKSFTETDFDLKTAEKIASAAAKYKADTYDARMKKAMRKYEKAAAAGKPLLVGKTITNDEFGVKGKVIEHTFTAAARNRLIESEVIDDDLKDRYLNCDVSTLGIDDVRYLVETGVLPGAGLTNVQAVRNMVKSGDAYQHLLQPSDLLTDTGISQLEKLPYFHGVLYGHYGSNTPKLMQGFTPYNSEIALLPEKKNNSTTLAKYLYSIAGVRMQSFSDFQIQNIYDYLQMVGDLAARKLPAHAYTKEISFARLLGMTGIKTNLSVMFDIDPTGGKKHAGLTKYNPLVHKGEYAQTVFEDEDGKWVYNVGDYATQQAFLAVNSEKRFLQSIGFADAVKLEMSEGYSKNCGIIGVGYSYNHILAMLNDNRIRYIIPYHSSGLPAEIKTATNIEYATDYQSVQNNTKIEEIRDAKGEKVTWSLKEALKRLKDPQAVLDELNRHIHEDGWVVKGKKVKGQEGHGSFPLYEDLQKTNDPKATVRNYIAWCVKNGTLPVFSEFASHENYYKMVYDFNVYDCITEEYAPQEAVTNTYPTQAGDKVVPQDILDGGFDTAYMEKTITKQMRFMNEYNRNLDSDLDRLAANAAKGKFTLDDEVDIRGMAKGGKTSYSLRSVTPVVPSSNAWQSTHSESWFAQHGFPLYRDVPAEQRTANEQAEMDKRHGGHGTQNKSTVVTYRKIFEFLQKRGGDPRILDASSGLGEGTKVGKQMGLDVHDIEPYPNESYHPEWTDYSELQDRVESGEIEPFDVIISNAVLNVLAQDTRDNLVSAMDSLLAPGGQMFVNVIGKDYAGAKNASAETQYVTRGGKQVPVGTVLTQEGSADIGREVFVYQSNSIQKVFGTTELKAYLQDALGEGYVIETPARAWKGSGLSGTMMVVTKPGAKYSARESVLDSNGQINPKEYYKVLHKPDSGRGYLSSLRNTEGVSNRSLLANALESAAQNDIERKKLTEYKGKIEAMDAEERKLHDLRAQIRELSSDKSKADEVAKLRDEATAAANRINTYDKQLLRLEAAAPLQGVLEREKTLAKQRATERGREAMAQYRQRTLEREREKRDALAERYRDSRQAALAKQAERYRDSKQAALDRQKERAQAKQDAMKEQHREAMQDLRAKEKDKREALKEEYKQKLKDRLDKQREKDAEKLGEAVRNGRENLRRYRENRDERDRVNKYRKRIKEQVKTFSEWLLKPSNKDIKKHIPAELQKTMADFLESINFESATSLKTGGAEITQADERYLKAMKKLRDAIKANVDSSGLYSGYADFPIQFAENFDSLITVVEDYIDQHNGEYVINQMSSDELKQLWQTLKVLKKFITTVNEFHNNAVFQHAYDAGESTIQELSEFNKSRASGIVHKFFSFDYMRPSYAFERMGKAAQSIEHEFREGQAVQAKLAQQIIDFATSAYTGKEVKQWGEEVKSFDLESGETVKLPVTHIMSLYCLNKRPQALTHIFGDGIRAANFKNGKQVELDEGHLVTINDVTNMISTLTDRQKEVADKLQRFMSTEASKWGNYVSMMRFDIEAFTEENYFPINSDGRYLAATADESPDNAGLYTLLNSGFTKELKPNAKNRIILYNVFDVFANHTASMTQYRAFALPVLDALKWFNYKNDDTSVRGKLSMAFGAKEDSRAGSGSKGYAEDFVLNLLRAYNGTAAQGDPYDSFGLQALHRFNRAAIAFNFRVVIQQPLAITRAAMILSPAKLAKGLGMSVTHLKSLANEMEEHSGIALWKSLGFYDTNISRGLTDLIKQNPDFGEQVTEIGTKGAEIADRLTWAAMWQASKDSVDRSQYESEDAYFEAVNELFEDVIYKTQVVDSVLTKSEFLRAKGFFPRMMGAFMSEPMTTTSMLTSAYFNYTDNIQKGMSRSEAWQKSKGLIGKTAAVYVIGQVLLAVAQGIMDGWRDDDEYDSENWLNNFFRRWMNATKTNIVEELLPFGKIPFVSEAYELVKSFLDDVGVFDKLGLDMYGSDISNGWAQYLKYLQKGTEITLDLIQGEKTNYTAYGAIYNFIRGASGMTGYPIATAWREVQDIWNNTVGYFAPNMKLKTYERAIDRSYLDYVRPTGLSQTDFEGILAKADENGDGNGSAKQDELGAELERQVLAGEITEEQANAVWDSKQWKKSFDDWKNSEKKDETATATTTSTAKSTASTTSTKPATTEYGYADYSKAAPLYGSDKKQGAYDVWETELSGSMTLKRFTSILTSADTDGNGSLKQDELGNALHASIKRGEMSYEQASKIWDSQGWSHSFDYWTDRH